MNDADRDVLANQKFKEGLKLCYAKNYSDAYNHRGVAYDDLEQYDRAKFNQLYNKSKKKLKLWRS